MRQYNNRLVGDALFYAIGILYIALRHDLDGVHLMISDVSGSKPGIAFTISAVVSSRPDIIPSYCLHAVTCRSFRVRISEDGTLVQDCSVWLGLCIEQARTSVLVGLKTSHQY